MKKITFLFLAHLLLLGILQAQNEKDEEKKKGFKKENLFTGGSISLAFYNNTFLIGGSPVLGYSLTRWLDAGVVVNYNYTSYRDYQNVFDAKLKQTNYGGGAFLKLYPIKFLFAQAQVEHNWLNLKYLPPNNGNTIKSKATGNSLLIGGGYCTGRESGSGQPFYYLSVMFDIADDPNSPYTDQYGRAIPIIRGGLQIPLFQGKNNNTRNNY